VSHFELNRFNYDLQQSDAKRAFQRDEESFLARYQLTPEERALIDARDWKGLVDIGVNVYILANFGAAVGLSFAEVGADLRGETPEQMAAFIEEQSKRVAPYRIVPGEVAGNG
jgi:protocatechuate 4,5-dioxygenase alpha subunit